MTLAKCNAPEILSVESWARWGWAVQAACAKYGVAVSTLLGNARGQLVDRARREVYAALYGSGLGYSEIGRLLGRDHTSVLAGVRKELAS